MLSQNDIRLPGLASGTILHDDVVMFDADTLQTHTPAVHMASDNFCMEPTYLGSPGTPPLSLRYTTSRNFGPKNDCVIMTLEDAGQTTIPFVQYALSLFMFYLKGN